MSKKTQELRVAIHGAAGRMGRRLVHLGHEALELTVVAAIEDADHPQLGTDAGVVAGIGPIDVPLGTTMDNPDVVIDFSVPSAATKMVALCAARHIPMVVATTGMDPTQEAQIRAASEEIPIVWSPNMSLAVNLALKLAAIAAQALHCHASGVDVEIIETHHRFKEDAPSGTALKFGETIASAMGQTQHIHGRHGRPGIRPRNEIAYHAIRAGDHPGEHTILFGMLGESLEVKVRATDRDAYALGALAAAKFVAPRPPGLYSMWDVLQLSS